MTKDPKYGTARPDSVGPHDVNKDQNNPEAPKLKPEEAYNNEVGGQAAVVGPKGSSKGSEALTKPRE
jgi:hypothetical protein